MGYNAAPSPEAGNVVRNTLRETLARVKLYIDMWFGNEPQFVSTPDYK